MIIRLPKEKYGERQRKSKGREEGKGKEQARKKERKGKERELADVRA